MITRNTLARVAWLAAHDTGHTRGDPQAERLLNAAIGIIRFEPEMVELMEDADDDQVFMALLAKEALDKLGVDHPATVLLYRLYMGWLLLNDPDEVRRQGMYEEAQIDLEKSVDAAKNLLQALVYLKGDKVLDRIHEEGLTAVLDSVDGDPSIPVFD